MTLTGRFGQCPTHSFTKGNGMANGGANSGEVTARRANPWRLAGWGLVALLLLLPAAAMRFTSEVNWTASDFVFAAVLLGSVGGAFELAVRSSRDPFYRGGVAAALAAAFMIVWATGAVGMVGDQGDPFNLLFLALLPLALAGAALARFGARGMMWAMVVTGAAQVAISIAGIAIDPRGALVSAAFGGLWLLSAALFRESVRRAPA